MKKTHNTRLKEITERLERAKAIVPGPWEWTAAEGYCSIDQDDPDKCEAGVKVIGKGDPCNNCNCEWNKCLYPAFVTTPMTLYNGDFDGLNNECAELMAHSIDDIQWLIEEVKFWRDDV